MKPQGRTTSDKDGGQSPAATESAPYCDKCPARAGDEWRQRALVFRLELMRFKLDDTQRRLADALTLITLGWGRESIMVPDYKFFSALTGLEKPHVSDALKALHLQRVIRVQRDRKGQRHYSLNESSTTWQATPRELMMDRDERIRQLRAVNEMEEKEISNFFKVPTAAKNFGADVTGQVTTGVTAEGFTLLETLEDWDDDLL